MLRKQLFAYTSLRCLHAGFNPSVNHTPPGPSSRLLPIEPRT